MWIGRSIQVGCEMVQSRSLLTFLALAMTAVSGCDADHDWKVGVGNAERGKLALREYACDSCHTIAGVVGPDAMVGPPLQNISERRYIAGVLLNTPDNMIVWIRHPQDVRPLTAMPDMGVSEVHARDMVAYLSSH